jgi:hypothetical protein
MRQIGQWLWLAIVTGLCVRGGCAGNNPVRYHCGLHEKLRSGGPSRRYSDSGEDQRTTIPGEGAGVHFRLVRM